MNLHESFGKLLANYYPFIHTFAYDLLRIHMYLPKANYSQLFEVFVKICLQFTKTLNSYNSD